MGDIDVYFLAKTGVDSWKLSKHLTVHLQVWLSTTWRKMRHVRWHHTQRRSKHALTKALLPGCRGCHVDISWSASGRCRAQGRRDRVTSGCTEPVRAAADSRPPASSRKGRCLWPTSAAKTKAAPHFAGSYYLQCVHCNSIVWYTLCLAAPTGCWFS